MDSFSIGEIARQAGIETSTIRYYERIGLLPRTARLNGRRIYDGFVLKRLALIRATQAAGFTIAEIITLIGLWESQGHAPDNWRVFVEKKLAETEALISEAERTKKLLTSALACECWDTYTMPFDSFVDEVVI